MRENANHYYLQGEVPRCPPPIAFVFGYVLEDRKIRYMYSNASLESRRSGLAAGHLTRCGHYSLRVVYALRLFRAAAAASEKTPGPSERERNS